MSVEIKKIGGFGDLLRITNGIIDVDVSTAFGPHILYLGFCGGQNFFHIDTDGELFVDDEKMNLFEEGAVWKNYGGHRLWQSPEVLPRTYLPCNDPVEVEIKENGAVFKQKLFRHTNTKAEIEVVMSENEAKCEVIHRVTNKNAWSAKMALWALSVMEIGGVEIVPMPTKDTGLVSNGVMGLWPYGKLNDERVHFGENFISLKPTKNTDKKFKIGLCNRENYAAYLMNDEMFVKRFEYVEGAEYPDGGMNFETYTDKNFLECETLGKYETLEYDQTAEYSEHWELYKGIKTPDFDDDKAINEIMNKIK